MFTLEHELNIDSTPSAAYEALTTEKGLRSWHTADATGDGPSGGLWHMHKDSKTPFIWEVIGHRTTWWAGVANPGREHLRERRCTS